MIIQPLRYTTLMSVVFFSSLLATPTELFNQRSQPMGNVKPSQLLQDSTDLTQINQYLVSNMPSRFQWVANHGYCGEVSFISAGLKYGQYVSQYTARSTVNAPGSQSQEILLGVNDDAAADQLHLRYAPRWNQQNTPQFLTWIKAYILNDHPVIIGVYTNECLFYNLCKKPHLQGDAEYDHIVSVIGIQSSQPLTPPSLPPPPFPTYIGNDRIIFSDHGLQGPVDDPTNSPCLPNPGNPYQFDYTFDQFQATRRQANTNNQWYSLSKNTTTYGIAILGVKDAFGETIPVTVATQARQSCDVSPSGDPYLNYEYPSIRDGSSTAPAPMPLTLTITVTIPDPTKAYTVYRYNSLANIPDSDFNGHASQASQSWQIPAGYGATYVFTQDIMSNEVAAYRAVISP